MTDLNEAQETEDDNVDIDDIFDDSTEDETAEVVEQEPETEPVEAEEEEQQGETEEEATEQEAEAEESEPPTDTVKTVPIAVVQAERLKRQEAEERERQVAEKLKQYEQPEQVVDLPDPQEDPQGYKDALKAQIKQEIQTEKITDSIESVTDPSSKNYKFDYKEKEKVYLVLEALNPDLRNELNESSNPAGFAYQKAEEYLQSLAPGAEPVVLPAEVSKADKRKKSAVQVPNLTKTASKGSNTVAVEQDEDIDEMFSDQAY